MQQHVNVLSTGLRKIERQQGCPPRQQMRRMPRQGPEIHCTRERGIDLLKQARLRGGTSARLHRRIAACALWKRNGRPKDIVRVVVPFGPDEPVRVSAKAMRRPLRVAWSQQIGIAAWQRDRVKRAPGISRPFAMLLLVWLACTLNRRGQDLNEQMITAEPERRGVGGHVASGTLELVGE